MFLLLLHNDHLRPCFTGLLTFVQRLNFSLEYSADSGALLAECLRCFGVGTEPAATQMIRRRLRKEISRTIHKIFSLRKMAYFHTIKLICTLEGACGAR